MPLSAGDKLGPYEILSPLGAGGMGEVYKARDTRLDRSVAIKVLPEHIARREDLRARFAREARTVASLNHPHICALYDIGEQGSTRYMVMELLEGETLAARIEKGVIALEQALGYATQIADALDRAHRAGVTHRDVKPGNIMLTRDGVKVLDFGLAKSTAQPGPTEETLTAEGAVMGTPQYMGPEQFGGKEADARSDIWAFGAVLYEMVTGRKAFQGKSYTSLVGAILGQEPAPMVVKPFTPAWLERLVRRCLAKDPEDRWQSMRDVVLELRSPAVDSGAPAKVSRWPWLLATVATLALLAVLAIHFRQAPPEQPVLTVSINPPANALFNEIALSPDGKLLAFTTAGEVGREPLWVRPLHSLSAQPLAGTGGAANLFWSPDSRWIGFFAQGKLKKIEASGGQAQTICDAGSVAEGGWGGSWSKDGVILYSEDALGLLRVPAQGGTPRLITTLNQARQEKRHAWPVFLPGGRQYLYLIMSSDPSVEGIYLGALDTKERTRLAGERSSAAYAAGPTGDGYLLFVRAGTLMAQPLDSAKGTATGGAVSVAEKVGVEFFRYRASFSVSGNGMLVHHSSRQIELSQLVWMGRGGKRLATVGEPAYVSAPWLSPDGKQVAFNITDAKDGSTNIWLYDLARGIPTPFTSGRWHRGGGSVWSPDGSRIAFASDREGTLSVYQKMASGAGQEELLVKSGMLAAPSDWSPDGRSLLFMSLHPKTKYDLWLLPMDGERKPVAVTQTEFNESNGAFSPDGRWIAYQSDASGRDEIYVEPYPATGAKQQVSNGGGQWPRWRRDGKELFWLEFDGTMMAAVVSAGQTFQAGVPAPLFETGVTMPFERYSVSPDGQRFLLPMRVGEAGVAGSATLVLNWLAGAKR